MAFQQLKQALRVKDLGAEIVPPRARYPWPDKGQTKDSQDGFLIILISRMRCVYLVRIAD